MRWSASQVKIGWWWYIFVDAYIVVPTSFIHAHCCGVCMYNGFDNVCVNFLRHDCLCSVYIPFNKLASTTFTYFPGIVMVITEPACLRILCFYPIIIILLYSHEIHELSWSRSVAPCIGKVYRTCTWFDLDYAWMSLSLQFKASLLGQCEQEMPLSIRLRIIWILKSV